MPEYFVIVNKDEQFWNKFSHAWVDVYFDATWYTKQQLDEERTFFHPRLGVRSVNVKEYQPRAGQPNW